ncbi:OmpA family domain protein [Candidatus Vecturithrix granuli]|uniref:OmpA family domain protein n=1 Tax=Vecturithrix granuli TaxID=1499967 RepID=A0A081BV60_VECG1|nr:OmpA family domain protein [Candidatus Vecturithrix granuli]
MKTRYAIAHIMFVMFCTMLLAAAVVGQAQPAPSETRKIVPVPRENIEVTAWFDKQCGAPYTQGEKIMINFRANKDAYITVYDIDTRGQVSVLFPNKMMPDNLVRGNQTYSMPNPSYTYDLVVEGPEGIEYVDVVASSDPYYQWNYNQGEPPWLQEWGLKGQQQRSISSQSDSTYKQSSEFQNRPSQLSPEGEKNLARNFSLSQGLRKQIQSKMVVQPRVVEQPKSQDYGTATCYFYVVSAQLKPNPTRPPQSYPTPLPSDEQYLQQLQQTLQQRTRYNITQSGKRLIVKIPNEINGRTFLFEFDSYALRNGARQDLDMIADILMQYPATKIVVAGHTDNIGSAEYNQRLSKHRAKAVADYLINRSVQPSRISRVGYGESRPVASNSTEQGRRLNRRIELVIRVNTQR